MRRPARGATSHPAMKRPGIGFGRPLRASPDWSEAADLAADWRAFLRGEVTEIPRVIDLRPDRSSVTPSDSRT
jgi:hypothetical protein